MLALCSAAIGLALAPPLAGTAMMAEAVRAKGTPNASAGALVFRRVGVQVRTFSGRRGIPVRLEGVWEVDGPRYWAVLSTPAPNPFEYVAVNDGRTAWVKQDGAVKPQNKKDTGKEREDGFIAEVGKLQKLGGIEGLRYERRPDSGAGAGHCRVVRVSAPEMPDITLLFDAKTHLLSAMATRTLGTDGVRRSSVSTYRCYQRVSGVAIAMKTSTDLGNGLEVTETSLETGEFVPLANFANAFKKP